MTHLGRLGHLSPAGWRLLSRRRAVIMTKQEKFLRPQHMGHPQLRSTLRATKPML